MNRKENGILKNLLYNKVTIVVFLLIATFALLSAVELYSKERISKDEKDRAQSEFELISKRKGELTDYLSDVSSDRGMEAVLRSEFNVAKPGEETIILLDDNKAQDTEKKQGLFGIFGKLLSK